jgi:hypothetical protein
MSNDVKKEQVYVDADEFAVAEKEAVNSDYTYTHKFRKPFEYQGKTYNELTFEWGKLTGKDGLAIENELQQLGKAVIVPTFSGEYLIRIAARACTVPLGADVFEIMPIADYNKIRSAARSFLLKSEL